MRKIFFSLLSICLVATACQKALSTQTTDNGTGVTQGGDSTFTPSDTLAYEVITNDTSGWYGMWTGENAELMSNDLDSGSYGSPVYFKSGWKYTFVPKHAPFQMMMSVDARNYVDDITINLYKNGQLIKTQTNSPGKGFSKVLMDIIDDTTKGTAQDPVVTYEVLVDNMDTTAFEHDGWIGHWTGPEGNSSLINNALGLDFAIPGGWRYSFHPKSLPFTMSMQASPYTKGGAMATINFYVNGVLVKTSSADDFVYPPMTYDVL